MFVLFCLTVWLERLFKFLMLLKGICLPGYYGIKCEKNENDVFVHQGTKCKLILWFFILKSRLCWLYISLATLTKKADPCSLKNCQNNSTCILDTTRHIYICQCQEGFTGATCESGNYYFIFNIKGEIWTRFCLRKK